MVAISSRTGHAAAAQNLSRLTEAVAAAQRQIASARRVDSPADDPVAFVRAAALAREAAAGEAQDRAMAAASQRLAATDVALGSITGIVQRVKELVLAGANATLTAADRTALATEARELHTAVLGLAESRGADGERLFAGVVASGRTYAPDAEGQQAWQGAGTAPAVAADGSLVEGGLPGPLVFGTSMTASPETPGSRSLFDSIAGLVTALDEPDASRRAPLLDSVLTELDDHIDRLANAQAAVGARAARLEQAQERLDRQQLAIAKDRSRLEDLDMPQAIAEMQRLLTVLEAAQASFARISSLSVWDQLRG
jgi:flagellar hook-associated protein 3 FlgL